MNNIDKIAEIFNSDIVLACQLAKGADIDLMDLFEYVWNKYLLVSDFNFYTLSNNKFKIHYIQSLLDTPYQLVTYSKKLPIVNYFSKREDCFKYIIGIEQLNL